DYKGRELEVKIADLDQEQNRIILSHRAVTEEAAEKEKQQLLQSLEAGQVVKGTVQRITSFGAFVDIGGVDGLVHISELSHTHRSEERRVGKECQDRWWRCEWRKKNV